MVTIGGRAEKLRRVGAKGTKAPPVPPARSTVTTDLHDKQLQLRLCRGLVVSALDIRSEEGRWFEPGRPCSVSLDKKVYSTLSLFIQLYRWIPAIIILGVMVR